MIGRTGLGWLLVVTGSLGATATAFAQPATPPAQPEPAGQAPSASGSLPPAPAGDAADQPDKKSEKESEIPKSAIPGPIYVPKVTGVRVRKGAPPPPAPTPDQLKALEILEQEAQAYESGAKEFRRSLTMIVRHHYEERRRRVLNALDREIDIERKGLVDARDEAIRRLEAFIAKYSGDNAHPKATPDAMFRLAALYEEKARSDFDADLTVGLQPAITLYRRIVDEFPQYEEIAAVHYYLGHAFWDSSRLDEAQQAWRSLVCSNRFEVQASPESPEKILVQPLPQDHDQKFWNEWYNKHPVPFDQGGMAAGQPADGQAMPEEEEVRFRDPYPAECEPLPQDTLEGEDPRYLAEVWWQLGNFHFDQIDTNGGPYHLNRAASAYSHSMKYEKPPLYGVAMYKLAWTYFKQQRYRTAIEEFVNLLRYADEQEEKTGDPGADFRSEAYTYIAGSLTYVDLDGPPPSHPFIPRSDVLDTELDPLEAERKMSIAIERVQDPELVPQDQKWTVEIYKALAQEFIEITQNRNAVATLEITLKRFPLDRDAPIMQNKVAELYEQLSKLAPEGSDVRAQYAAKALEARTKLAAYVGTTPWTDANRDDPEALQQAEQLVRTGLKRAAADHTNNARAYYDKALTLNDEAEQTTLIEKSIAEYRLAETGWAAYIEQDPTALDAYESRYWLADARYWVVVLQIALGRTPTPDEIRLAREANVDVRDSNEDDRYMQPAAYNVVTLSEKVLENEYRQYEESGGSRGVEKREEVRFVGEGEDRKAVTDPIPPPVEEAIRARDEYNARIPLERDPERNGLLYAFQAADYYFVYGHFDQARARFTPMYEHLCGKDEWGYKAWEKLISMSNFEGDEQRSRELAEGKSCAFDEESRKAEENIRKPVMQGVAYLDARRLYEEAEKMPPGPERDKKWRAAAAAYKTALDAAPDRDEAPEAAMNGAYAYKQVGEYDKAIEMYELFISRYGNEETLQKLKNGDPKGEPPKPPQPEKYEERVKYLKMAYDALAGAYVLFFDYPKAAKTFDDISKIEHFPPGERLEAAKQALSLYSSLDDRGSMDRVRDRYRALGASPKEIAEADFVVASSQLKKWDEFSPDEGANAAARRRATQSMMDYYVRYKAQAPAAEYVTRAAYWVAKMKHSARAGDTNKWWRNTIDAFQRYKAVAPRQAGKSSAVGTAEAGMAAEAEYTMLDEKLRRDFDYETGHHRYKGTPVDVVKEYNKDAIAAKKHYDELQRITDEYVSPEWTVTAIARQGSLYDSLRTGLYNARPPAVKLFDDKTERLLKKAEESGNLDLQEKADAVRVKVQTAWRNKRDQELDSADRIMVDRYAQAVVLARRYNISNPQVTRAIRRLAFFTDVIGEAKLKQYAGGVKDLNYTPGMFPRMRPGIVTAPEPDGMPHPLPVVPAP